MTPLDLNGIASSYRKNDWGPFFYGTTRALKPQVVVELGTYQGYSALHIAAAMRENGVRLSSIQMIDLWGRYPFRNCSVDIPRRLFARNRVDNLTEPTPFFVEDDAASASICFRAACVDLLHIDLSNDGDLLASVMPAWEPKLSDRGMVLIEGGSAERDNVEWMQKYGKRPIREWLASSWVTERFDWLTLAPFPSLTIMRRR